MIYTFLATGYEEVEALTIVDILRRAGMEVATVSMTGNKMVVSSHQVTVVADYLFEEVDFADAEMLFLPGGMPGASNLDQHVGLQQVLLAQAEKGGFIAAVCAAPMVLGHLGLLKGKRCTCYPGFEEALKGGNYTGGIVEVDGNFITGRGPAACMELGYTMVELLVGKEKAATLREGMMYNQLMATK